MYGFQSATLLLFQPTGNNALVGPIVMYGAIFAIFYFILIRPQQRQKRQHEELIQNLKRGDEVTTTGGIIGEVVHIRETVKDGTPQRTMEDRVTIKSGDARLVIERGRITRIVSASSKADAKNSDMKSSEGKADAKGDRLDA